MATMTTEDDRLDVWPSDFGLASVDVGCLQSMAAVKMAAAPVQFVDSRSPWKSPSGNFPLLRNNGKVTATSFEEVVDYLRGLNQEIVLDGELTPSQKAEFVAYTSYLKYRLYPALLHNLWLDEANFQYVTHHWFSSTIYFPFNVMYIERQRRQARAVVDGTRRTENELIVDAIKVLNGLSAKLGDNKYFCGDKPCSLDALIFGYLAPILKLPLPSDRLQIQLSSLPNLVRFVESIISIYLPLTEDQIRLQNEGKHEWEKRKTKAQRAAEERRQRREQKKSQEQAAKDNSIVNTVLFAAGAVTLSLLFAVHTGMISFINEDDDFLEDVN